MRAQTVHDAYRSLLAEMRSGTDLYQETNTRTGVDVTSVSGGWSFKVSLGDCRVPVPGNRRYRPYVAAAEAAWQLMGTQYTEWIDGVAPRLWEKFQDAPGLLRAAYGWRWRRRFARDQIAMAMHALNADPSDRRVFVSTWDPSCDGLGQEGQPKNVPCITGFSLTRSGRLLHMSVFMRSSDVFVGLPYDVMGYALTLDAVAAEIGCVPATLHFTLAHAHLYEPHKTALFQCIHGSHADWLDWRAVSPPLPAWSVSRIERDPDGYVEHVKVLSARCARHPWDPKPELVE